MTELQKYDCHCHMDADGNSPVFYLASEVDERIAQLRHAWEVERLANQPKGDAVTVRTGAEP